MSKRVPVAHLSDKPINSAIELSCREMANRETPDSVDPGPLIVRLQAPNPDVPITDARASLQLERQLRVVSRVDVRCHGWSRGAVQLSAVVHDGAIPKNREG